MLKIRFTHIYILILMMSLSACHKDEVYEESTTSVINTTTPVNYLEVNSSVVGIVTDTDDNPVANATVAFYKGETTTDEYGIFSFENVVMDQQGTFFRVDRSGFISESFRHYPSENSTGIVRVKLIPKTSGESLSNNGGNVEITDGLTANFQMNSVLNSDGFPVNGDFRVIINQIPLSFSRSNQIASPGFIGLDSQGRHRALSAISMVELYLVDQNENILSIDPDAPVQVNFNTADVSGSLPELTTLWYFDEFDGFWKESGTAQKEGNAYTGEVSKSAKWLIANDHAMVHVCGQVVTEDGLPAKHYNVEVQQNGKITRLGTTDSDGNICGKFPADEVLEYKIYAPFCNDVLLSLEFGPFSSLTNLPQITVPMSEKYISGQVVCGENPLPNAILLISMGSNQTPVLTDENGEYVFDELTLACEEFDTYEIFAYTESETMQFVFGIDSLALGVLNLCDSECDINISYAFEKDIKCEDGPYDRVSLVIEGGSGDFSYEWEDGSNSSTFSNPTPNDILCITVTDNEDNCQSAYCAQVPRYKALELLSVTSTQTSCDPNSGAVDVIKVGGKSPFVYNWIGPNGFSSTDSLIADLPPGDYTLEITDSDGCFVTETIFVEGVATELDFIVSDFCDITTIEVLVDGGVGPYEYIWSDGEVVENEVIIYSPGTYFVTVADALGCVITGNVQIVNVGLLPANFSSEYECNGTQIHMLNAEDGYEYYYLPRSTSTEMQVDFQGNELLLSIFETSYEFDFIVSVQGNPNCRSVEEVELPHFMGLGNVNVNHPSCDMCNDGFIEYEIDVDAECTLGCTLGSIDLIDSNFESVMGLNQDEMLGLGTYYLVAYDNAGCMIAHSTIIIE